MFRRHIPQEAEVIFFCFYSFRMMFVFADWWEWTFIAVPVFFAIANGFAYFPQYSQQAFSIYSFLSILIFRPFINMSLYTHLTDDNSCVCFHCCKFLLLPCFLQLFIPRRFVLLSIKVSLTYAQILFFCVSHSFEEIISRLFRYTNGQVRSEGYVSRKIMHDPLVSQGQSECP